VKILFVTPRFPYPPFRGDKLKIYNLIRELSGRHEVTLLSFTQNAEEEGLRSEMEKLCARVETVKLPLAQSLLQCGLAIPGRTPFQVAYFRSRAMAEAVKRVTAECAPDVIHTHLLRMAPYTASRGEIPRILDLTDAVGIYLRRFAESTRNPVKRFILREEYRRVRGFERVLEKFNCCLVCSTTDREALHDTAPAARIEILENGIDLASFTPDTTAQPDPRTIVCTGNMSYFPNADGVKYFVEEILPLVRVEIPDVRFLIVGQNPPRAIRSLEGNGITVTGTVPDIREYYLRAAVAVSPIRFGSGTLNKVLEPMALGIPVVATTIGIEGLPFKEREHLLIGRTPEEFAAHVVHVIQNPEAGRRIAERARELVRGKYSWKRIGEKLEGFYASIVADHPSPKSGS
jgi:sugar transferase (PEP-CTERM/EpsH1 system associated)